MQQEHYQIHVIKKRNENSNNNSINIRLTNISNNIVKIFEMCVTVVRLQCIAPKIWCSIISSDDTMPLNNISNILSANLMICFVIFVLCRVLCIFLSSLFFVIFVLQRWHVFYLIFGRVTFWFDHNFFFSFSKKKENKTGKKATISIFWNLYI